MTMLDRMRRHKGWLKWSLAIVVLAFIILYIPSFLRPDVCRQQRRRRLGRGPGDHRRSVPAGLPAADAGLSRAVRRQRRRAAAEAARHRSAHRPADDRGRGGARRGPRLGISATDEEVRRAILHMPAFQENGQFIGDQRYRQLLQMQNPPLHAARVRGAGPPRHHARASCSAR